MLKNYTVKIKNVNIGKQNQLINYIANNEHKNHTHTTILLDNFLDGEKFKILLMKMLHLNEINYFKKGKGGKKLKRIAKTLIFNLPKSYKASEEQLKIINIKLLKGLEKIFQGLDIGLDKRALFSAIHKEEHKQNHIHLIIPTLDMKGNNIRYLNTPAFANKIKVMFTEIVDNVLNTHISEYIQLTEEERQAERIKTELKALQTEYTVLQANFTEDSKAYKYIKNELIKIQRTLNANNPDTDYIKKINKGVENVLKANSTNKLNTTNIKPITI